MEDKWTYKAHSQWLWVWTICHSRIWGKHRLIDQDWEGEVTKAKCVDVKPTLYLIDGIRDLV